MTLQAIAEACGGLLHGCDEDASRLVESVVIDSRNAKEGSLFIAIKGKRADGHSFIAQVYDKGAVCCISEIKLDSDVTKGKPYIEVKSSLQALKDIAEYYRSRLDVKVVGVTGSVGKTSTKEAIAAVLSQRYNVYKTAGNFNNEIGLPLTVFGLTEETQAAVLEMGISDFGEMTRLARIAKPDICVITNIGECHLENLKDRDGVLKAKSEIFEYMADDGAVILNGDDDKLVTIDNVKGKTPHFFGIENENLKSCGIYADNIDDMGLDGTICDICSSDGGRFTVHIPVPGKHMVYNALAGAAVGRLAGISDRHIKAGIESLEPMGGRNNIIRVGGLLIIDSCYNANPASMRASIDVLAQAAGRKVAILGDMFELGEGEVKLHYEVGCYAARNNIDLLVTAGSLAREIARGASDSGSRAVSYETKQEMLSDIRELVKPGDTILIKASHGMGFAEVVELLCNSQKTAV